METKLIAAEIATAAGVMTVICSSRNPRSITDIIAYHAAAAASPPTSGNSSPDESDVSTVATPRELLRPPHTAFTPSPTPLRDLKSWTSHTLNPSGSIVIDAGAHHVLSRRESGGRLLAAGVLAVRGAFAAGQAVRILVRRGPGSHAGQTAEEARAAYIAGLEVEGTRPTTPTIKPVASISSSVASLATLERNEHERQMPPVPEDDTVLVPHAGEEEAQEDWETEEVGRGLANYNSAQIARVKGLRRYVVPLCGSVYCADAQEARTWPSYWGMRTRSTWLRTSLFAYRREMYACFFATCSALRNPLVDLCGLPKCLESGVLSVDVELGGPVHVWISRFG